MRLNILICLLLFFLMCLFESGYAIEPPPTPPNNIPKSGGLSAIQKPTLPQQLNYRYTLTAQPTGQTPVPGPRAAPIIAIWNPTLNMWVNGSNSPIWPLPIIMQFGTSTNIAVYNQTPTWVKVYDFWWDWSSGTWRKIESQNDCPAGWSYPARFYADPRGWHVIKVANAYGESGWITIWVQ